MKKMMMVIVVFIEHLQLAKHLSQVLNMNYFTSAYNDTHFTGEKTEV